jgi:hypothetical protein
MDEPHSDPVVEVTLDQDSDDDIVPDSEEDSDELSESEPRASSTPKRRRIGPPASPVSPGPPASPVSPGPPASPVLHVLPQVPRLNVAAQIARGHGDEFDDLSEGEDFALADEPDSAEDHDPADDSEEDVPLQIEVEPGEHFPDRPMMNYPFDSVHPEDFERGWTRPEIGPEMDENQGPLDEGPPEGVPPFTGGTSTTIQGTQPIDFFTALFNETMWGEIATQTNLYAERTLERLGPDVIARMNNPAYQKHSRINLWKAVTAGDMKTFAAHLIVMGLIKKPTIESYWTTKGGLVTPFFGKYMTRTRFQSILSNFHVADDSQNPRRGVRGHNPLAKIQPFVTMMENNFRNCYKPGEAISIDEGICPWKGRLYFRQYNPQKPHKFHIKLFQVCDPQTGYCIHFKVFTGQGSCHREGITTTTDHTTTTHTVMTLATDANILDRGHTLYMDNWFNSPDLFEELWARDTKAVGTLRLRKNLSMAIKEVKATKNKPTRTNQLCMQPGDCIYRRRGPLLEFKWMEKRLVHMLSTKHTATFSYSGKKHHQTNEPIYKPTAIVDYTNLMGGVDLLDQLMNYYHPLRRSIKWWRKLWVHLFNMIVMNAYILNKKFGTKVMAHDQYREVLVQYLLGGQQPVHHPTSIVQNPDLSQRHYPQRLPRSQTNNKIKTRRCVLCKMKKVLKASTIECSKCSVALCVYPCFGVYHESM